MSTSILAFLISCLLLFAVAFLVLLLVMLSKARIGSFASASNEHTDILAEQETADFAMAAAVQKERRELEARAVTDVSAIPDDVEWQEPDNPYRPPLIELIALLEMLNIGMDAAPALSKGEHHVFINQKAMEKIESHLQSNTRVELGGLLVGRPYYCPSLDAYLVVVDDGYPAEGGKETSVSFEYTSDTWREMTPRLQEMPKDYVVVGSYHSHPGLGVFLSTTDIDTQVNVFSQEWQTALVIDPVRNETGFFISQAGVPVGYEVFETSQPTPSFSL